MFEKFQCKDDWAYYLADTSLRASDGGPFADLIELWRNKADPDTTDPSLPTWSDFELSDFQDWWGWLTVIDFLSDEPTDHVYRLWGSNLVNRLHVEMTGRKMSDHWGDCTDAQGSVSVDIALLAAIREQRKIGFSIGPIDRRYPGLGSVGTLRLPLSKDGKSVDQILNANILATTKNVWRPIPRTDRH